MTKSIDKYYEFYDYGTKDDAKTVVFLPGVACSTWMFRDAVQFLNPKYKVLIFNNPGTNGTKIPLNITVEKIAQIVLDVLNELNLSQCIVVGHSMGGYTAQTLHKLDQFKVSKLALVSSSCGFPFTKQEIKRFWKDWKSNFAERIKDFNNSPEKGIRISFSEHFIASDPVKYKIFAHRFFEMRPSALNVIRHFICASRFNGFDHLKDIQIPTIIFHGTDDEVINNGAAQMLHENINNSQLVVYENCGHFPMIEVQNFYSHVINFIEKSEKVKKVAS